jgi:hypothetical protein
MGAIIPILIASQVAKNRQSGQLPPSKPPSACAMAFWDAFVIELMVFGVIVFTTSFNSGMNDLYLRLVAATLDGGPLAFLLSLVSIFALPTLAALIAHSEVCPKSPSRPV